MANTTDKQNNSGRMDQDRTSSSTSNQSGSQTGQGHRAGTMADGTSNRREEDKSSINNRGSKFVE